MPNSDYDDLFDQWGSALNVNPQLSKSVFHAESGGLLNGNPMGITPAAAAKVAQEMGWDPKSVDISDMRWAVPIATRILADGLNATGGSGEGAAAYYNTGSTAPSQKGQNYVGLVGKLYPNMSLTTGRAAPDGNAIISTANGQMNQDGSTIGDFLKSHGQGLDATQGNWCAAFVNGVLEANGVHGAPPAGVGKNVASSFLEWGNPVDGDPQPGDVLVQSRGRAPGRTGGHVGIFAGQVADGDGGRYYLMTSGNYGDKVAYSWEPASSLVVRRAPELTQQSQPQPASPQQQPEQAEAP